MSDNLTIATTTTTTTLAVRGMTCASCVRSLESGLHSHLQVISVSVNLLAARAVVQHESALSTSQLVLLVEDLGYDADILSSTSTATPVKPTISTTLAVEGMTCSSCVRSLESGLAALPLVTTVSVNLLAGRAVVGHKAGLLPADLASHVEDLGYGAHVLSSDRVEIPTTSFSNSPPKDTIRIDADDKRWLSYLTDTFVASTTATLVSHEPRPKAHALIRYETPTTLQEHAIDIDTNDAWSIHSTGPRLNQEPQFSLDLLRKSSFNLAQPIDQGLWTRLSDALAAHTGVTQIERGDTTIHVTHHPLVTSARAISSVVGSIAGVNSLDLLKSDSAATAGGLSALVRNATRSREQHAAHTRVVRNRFLIGLAFAIPTFILAMVIGMFLPTTHSARHALEATPVFQGVSILDFTLLVFVTLCVGILGIPLARSATLSLVKRGKPDMDALISLGVWAGYLASVVGLVINAIQDAPLEPMVLFGDKTNMHMGHGRAQRIHLFFETPVFLLAFLGLGRWLEAIARGRAADAVAALVALQPDVVTQVVGGKWDGVGTVDGIVKEETVPSGNVHVGDFVKVIPGGRVPCDGVVISGSSLLDCSAITGEPIPVPARPFVRAASGALNAGPSAMILTVTNPAHSSTLARIATLVDSAQTSSAAAKSDAELLADRVSEAFVPLVLIISALTFIVWEVLLALDVLPVPSGFTAHTLALQYAVAVLVVACPCAVGLAVPTAVMVGAGVAAKHGVLVKDAGRVLERCAKMTYLVADKTGTLTVGKPTVVDDRYQPNAHESTSMDMLTFRSHVWAAIHKVENNSAHPLARAMMHRAQQFMAEFDPTNEISSAVTVHQVRETPGKGLSATIRITGLANEWQLWLGSPAFMSAIPTVQLPSLANVAGTIVGCAIQSTPTDSPRLASLHILDDPIRPEARAAVHALQQQYGVKLIMCTGDHATAAHRVAHSLGIQHVVAQSTPDEKLNVVRGIQAGQSSGVARTGAPLDTPNAAKPALVGMIGDGINDAAALAASDVGISLLDATDVAVHSASVLLTGRTNQGMLAALPALVALARRVRLRVRLNLVWALAYNCIGVVWASGALGTSPAPAIAGLAMAFSSVSVLVSSLALRWQRVPTIGLKQVLQDETTVDQQFDQEKSLKDRMVSRLRVDDSQDVDAKQCGTAEGRPCECGCAAANQNLLDKCKCLLCKCVPKVAPVVA